MNEIDAHRRELPLAAAPDVVPETAEEIAHAWRFLAQGPSVSIRAPSRFRAFGVFARRLLFRILRPYIARQREWESRRRQRAEAGRSPTRMRTVAHVAAMLVDAERA